MPRVEATPSQPGNGGAPGNGNIPGTDSAPGHESVPGHCSAHRHRLWALRHGESLANATGVIVSRPGPRAFEWAGLTDRGRAQARDGALTTPLGADTIVVTSDFARAAQTAAIVANTWGTAQPTVDVRLRERDFGVLDEGPDTEYQRVWKADSAGLPLPSQVEAPEHVAARTRSLVSELLALPGAADIVLVAHGDVLQITQAWLAGVEPSAHRSLPHLENAELRLLLPGE